MAMATELVRLFKPKVILFNLIGTIIPLDWQDECIEPFIRDNIHRFIEENWSKSEFVYEMITIQFQQESIEHYFHNDRKDCPLVLNFNRDHSNWMDVIDSVEKFIHWQMVNTQLTMSNQTLELLRLCWMDGYRKGMIKTKLFHDVKNNLNRWKSMNIQLAILSLTMNNDVCRLILTSTNDGNISEMFDYYFDEQTIDGHYRQTELQFYQQIMQSMNISIGNEILLINLKMAKENGNFQTLLLLRPLVNQQPPRSYYLIRFAHTDSLGRIEFV
ncbi:enolase-phosphatase e1 isoform x1 [Dermatophagoides farinae]|uniref:Enolase-phosphatase e1 isoform x1 n=1 Tax=Dermatophagoides farinae TaxID=6954 RepID=A0A9D4SEA5_DERFA|nr:enolase-phosphatase e1 isoform x1 [Dermatophagoides farinae]